MAFIVTAEGRFSRTPHLTERLQIQRYGTPECDETRPDGHIVCSKVRDDELCTPSNPGNEGRRRTTITIHDTPGYRLELCATEHPRFGATIELITTWPQANHPEPHRLLTLTLPRDAFARLAEALGLLADGAAV